MEVITGFFGRFHPLMVHLPIGILFLSFLFECLSFRESYRGLRKAIQPALFWGMIFSIAAAITGFFLRQEGGYDEVIADRHQNFGIATAVLCLIVYVLRPKVKYWVDTPRTKRLVKLALSVPLVLALIITGHWGGSLTHGEDYLFSAMRMNLGEEKDPAERIRTITNVEDAVLYNDVIQPILEARCYDCHSASKQKGDLRLDNEEFIRRGGKNGAVLADGPADSSALYKRLILPLEHEDHMPPNEKPQLSSSEIALIQYWIEDHADFKKTVSAFKSDEKISSIIKTLQQPPQQTWVPSGSAGEVSEKAMQRLAQAGISPMPIAQENNYLMVSFAGRRDVSDEQLTVLKEIEEQLVWLNLGHTAITDAQMNLIAQLRNLRVLYLNNTGITDAGIAKLSPLVELRWLSVVGTKVSDASVETFAKLTNLNTLFLFETNLTDQGITRILDAKQDIRIDTGNYRLEKLTTDTVVYKKVSGR
jgi:uncharacterized membrane protein